MGPHPTVSQARAWDATPLLYQATEWENAHDQVAQHTRVAAQLVNESTDFWRGDGGDGMRNRHTVTATAATTALFTAATAARNRYHLISAADSAALQAIRNAELDGYHIADDGAVTVTLAQTATAITLGPKATTALAVLDHGAQTHTTAIRTALAGLGHADTTTASAIDIAFRPMHDEPDVPEAGVDGGAGGGDAPLYHEEPEDGPPPEEKLPDGQEDGGHESRIVAPNVKTIDEVPLKVDASQLQKKFKHASDFGVTDPWPAGSDDYTKNLQFEMGQSIHIDGTYQKQPAILNYNPNDSTVVIQKPNGDFWSGWKLSPAQEQNIRDRGSL